LGRNLFPGCVKGPLLRGEFFAKRPTGLKGQQVRERKRVKKPGRLYGMPELAPSNKSKEALDLSSTKKGKIDIEKKGGKG